MHMEVISNSASFTRQLGAGFALFLDFGDVLILSGDLGGGKTTFIGGVAKGLGIKQDISSPSFTLINEYGLDGNRLVHADLYRLEGLEDLAGIGIDDYIYDRNSIVCIEWGDKLGDKLSKYYLNIDFKYDWDSQQRRKIIFNSGNTYWDRKLKGFGKKINEESSQ